MRQKISCTREAAYQRLTASDGLFVEDMGAILQPGEQFTLHSGDAEAWTGTVEFVQPPRGLCLKVREMNEALFWLAIEGAAGNQEVQLWLSAFGEPQQKVDAFEVKWAERLRLLLA